MRRPVKIAIVLALLVLLVIVLSGLSFHWTREERYCQSTFNFSDTLTDVNRVKTYSRVAIITPPADGHRRELQMAVAEKLKELLEKEPIVYDATRSATHSICASSSPTAVAIYQSKKEAMKDHPELMVRVRVKSFSYTLLPLPVRKWKAKVDIWGGSPADYDSIRFVDTPGRKFLDYQFRAEVQLSGKMTGIFSTGYLVSRIAEPIAADTVKQVSEHIKDAVEEFRTKKPSTRLPQSACPTL